MIWLAYIFIMLAAVCSAGMDRTEKPEAFAQSIFRNLNKKYWLKTDASDAVRLPFTDYPWNAWHNFKSGNIIFWICAMISFGLDFWLNHNSMFDVIDTPWLRIGAFVVFHLVVAGTTAIQTFNLFYKVIFFRK